ncbi:hypothetical protein E5288_WYG009575 [Bos mutus]|uniref:Uncharacterized protein n=1 Tax=Bos mutus TaxID=72004 RepID=A0A6B0QX38_9CETA|nr:hypothetical protein [Bos mutus]
MMGGHFTSIHSDFKRQPEYTIYAKDDCSQGLDAYTIDRFKSFKSVFNVTGHRVDNEKKVKLHPIAHPFDSVFASAALLARVAVFTLCGEDWIRKALRENKQGRMCLSPELPLEEKLEGGSNSQTVFLKWGILAYPAPFPLSNGFKTLLLSSHSLLKPPQSLRLSKDGSFFHKEIESHKMRCDLCSESSTTVRKKQIQDERTSLLHISAQKGVGMTEVGEPDVMHILASIYRIFGIIIETVGLVDDGYAGSSPTETDGKR